MRLSWLIGEQPTASRLWTAPVYRGFRPGPTGVTLPSRQDDGSIGAPALCCCGGTWSGDVDVSVMSTENHSKLSRTKWILTTCYLCPAGGVSSCKDPGDIQKLRLPKTLPVQLSTNFELPGLKNSALVMLDRLRKHPEWKKSSPYPTPLLTVPGEPNLRSREKQ